MSKTIRQSLYNWRESRPIMSTVIAGLIGFVIFAVLWNIALLFAAIWYVAKRRLDQ